MGGAESLYTGLNYLAWFAHIGSFSGALVMWARANSPAAPPAAAGGQRRPRTTAHGASRF